MKENYEEYLEKSKQYYDKRFGQDVDDAFRLNLDETERWDHIKHAVEKYTGNRKSEVNILDFGCGRGWLSQRLSAFGNVTGIDLSDEAINKAKQNFPDVNFICIDAAADLHQALSNQKFDLVVSSEVIEHVAKQQEYIDNMVSLLSDKGKIVLTTPNGKWKDHHFQKERKQWAQPFEFWLTKEALMKLTQGRLKNVSIATFYTSWLFDYSSHGMPDFLGNRLFRKFLSLLKLKQQYLKYLEKEGYGLYLLMEGFK